MSTDSEKQKDEIVALESIYNEEEFSYHEENNQYKCTAKVFISLPEGYYLTYKDNRQSDHLPEKVLISHLPPLTLFLTLPSNYPSDSPPNYKLCSSWLSQPVLAKLCKKLDHLWEENKGLEILYTWMAFLKDETLEFLNINTSLGINYAYTFYKAALERAQTVIGNEEKLNIESESGNIKYSEDTAIKNNCPVDGRVLPKKRGRKQKNKKLIDPRAVSDRPIGKNPVQVLVDYDAKRKQIEFKRNFYTCKICFSDKLGEHCTQFVPCRHVFCKDCIVGYLEVRIKEGTVQNICCPEEKCSSEATPGQVKDLVSPELFAQYDSILLSATLDTMTDIVYCPRRHCQYPVSREPEERMANCPACQYAFCIYCKMVYHGIEPCKFKSAEKQRLVKEYQGASAEKKAQLEQRYGKKQLQILVENTMSENWINTNSQHCPQCNAAIEKSDGCNKMVCWRCNTFFCWLCGVRLNPETPYLHFQSRQSKCYNMLFRGMAPEEGEDEEDEDDDEDANDFIYLEYGSEDEDFYDEDFVIQLDI